MAASHRITAAGGVRLNGATLTLAYPGLFIENRGRACAKLGQDGELIPVPDWEYPDSAELCETIDVDTLILLIEQMPLNFRRTIAASTRKSRRRIADVQGVHAQLDVGQLRQPGVNVGESLLEVQQAAARVEKAARLSREDLEYAEALEADLPDVDQEARRLRDLVNARAGRAVVDVFGEI